MGTCSYDKLFHGVEEKALATLLNSIALRVRSLGFIEKRLLMAIIVGFFSSIIIILFYFLVVLVVEFSIILIDGKFMATSDLSITAIESKRSYLLLVIIPLGALLSSLLVYKIEPLAKGPGVNITIKLYHYGLEMRKRTPIVKAIASALLVGSGGSGGLQGPSFQIGAGIGTIISRILGLNIIERRIMMVAGMAGALSAIFHSPIGSALFAVEVLYRRDLEADAIVAALAASITAYTVSANILGYQWFFPQVHATVSLFFKPIAILTYIILGVIAAGVTLAYIRLYHGVSRLFWWLEEKHRKPWLNPVIGSLPVAFIGFLVPHVIGSGSSTLSLILGMDYTNHSELRLLGVNIIITLAILVVAKMIATSFSIGSGGSGGLFAPSIFIGGLFGVLYGLVVGYPIAKLPVRAYAYIGMASVFGAATNTPLATAIMIAEMSDNYLLIIPAIIGSLIANELIKYDTLYPAQILRRTYPLVASLKTILEVMESRPKLRRLLVKDLENQEYQAVTIDCTLREAIKVMREYQQRFIPVTSSNGRILGIIDLETIRYAYRKNLVKVKLSQIPLKKDIVLLKPEEKLTKAVEKMIHYAKNYGIIVDKDKRYRGVLLVEDLAVIVSQYLIP